MLKKFLNLLHSWNTSSDAMSAALGLQEVSTATVLLSKKNWSELEALYVRLSAEERHFVLNGVAETGAPDGWYDPWLETGSNTARVFLGATLTVAAWKARGGLIGRWVTASQGADFHQLLTRAHEVLLAAQHEDPSDPEPLARLTRVMMGLGAGVDQLHNAYDGLEATGVPHLGGGWYMIDALSPKWGGSEQTMLSFARTQGARNNLSLPLIALAHTEIWLQFDMFEKNEVKATSYFLQADVREEVLGAYEKYTKVSAPGGFDLLARNGFAFALWKMNERQLAARELDGIGSRIAAKPWAYVDGNLPNAVNAARKDLGMGRVR